MSDMVHVPGPEFDFTAASAALATTNPTTLARIGTAGEGVVCLLDVSDSMNDRAGAGSTKSRFQAMEEAFAPLRGKCTVVAFSDEPIKLRGDQRIPSAGSLGYGGTRISLAIEEAARLKPARTVLICDGETYDKAECREAVRKLAGVLDTIYVGSDHDVSARMFLQELAELGGGTFSDLGGNALQLAAAVGPLMLCAVNPS